MKHTRGEKQKNDARQLRALYEKYQELNRIIWSQPKVTLPRPIQIGFKKSLVLREDIARRDDARVFHTILNKLNCTIYSKNQEFKVYTRKNNKLFATDREHVPRTLSRYEFEKWNPPPAIAKHFVHSKVTHVTKYGSYVTEHYSFITPWMFRPGPIEPHFKTEATVFHPEAESELGEIKRKMDSINFWEKARKMLKHHHSKEFRGTLEDKMFKEFLEEQIQEAIYESVLRNK